MFVANQFASCVVNTSKLNFILATIPCNYVKKIEHSLLNPCIQVEECAG